jgi:hypothetical protein
MPSGRQERTASDNSFPPMLVVVSLVMIAVGGCLSGGNTLQSSTSDPAHTPTATESATVPAAALDSTLARFVTADNHTTFAARHGIELEAGRVRVMVRLQAGTTLPRGYDIRVELQYEAERLAFVAISDLRPLAHHRNVTAVRVPDRPSPAEIDSVAPSMYINTPSTTPPSEPLA